MKYIKAFESFNVDPTREAYIYFDSLEAGFALAESDIYDELDSDGNLFFNDSIDNAISILEANDFVEGEDFFVLEAQGDVKLLGLKGNIIEVEVKGHKYGHASKEGGLAIEDISRKFEKMLQFSSWKALNWLNRQTKITFGAKKVQDADAAKLPEAPKTKPE